MSDNEETPSSLGNGSTKPVHSYILSVKHPVASTIPAFPKELEEGMEITCFVVFSLSGVDVTFTRRVTRPRRQDAGDILPRQPAGANSFSQRQELNCEVAARVVQSESLSRDAEGLAGGAADKKVNWSDMVLLDLREVPEEGKDVAFRAVAMIPIDGQRAQPLLKHGAREGVDLGKTGRCPAERMPGDGCGLDAAANAQIAHQAVGSRVSAGSVHTSC